MIQTLVNKKESYNLWYIYFACSVATLGGVMFGFDLGIITGVVPYIEHQFSLSGFSLGVVIAIFELGAMVGAFGVARYANKYGRKSTMIVVALFLGLTSVGVAFAKGVFLLALWRCFQGVFVGAASVLSPMYIAEITPAKIRGKMVSIYQLSIIFGILISSISNYYFGDNDLESLKWRFMFLTALAPSFVFFVLAFLVPESPRWLVQYSKNEHEAGRIFQKINNYDELHTRNEITQVKDSLQSNNENSQVPLKVLLGKVFFPIVLIGFGIAFLQQFCGINNVTPYLQKIFIMAGLQLKDGLLNAIFVQLIFLVSTFIAIALIDRIGRKLLMLVGTGLMAVTLFLLAWAFYVGTFSGFFILVIVMVYIATFGFTLGPVVWVLISEMFPNKIRGRAIALTSAALWLATFFVILISPYLLEIGPVFNFILFGIFNILGFFFCLIYLPETKGKTLEEMEELWINRLKKNK